MNLLNFFLPKYPNDPDSTLTQHQLFAWSKGRVDKTSVFWFLLEQKWQIVMSRLLLGN